MARISSKIATDAANDLIYSFEEAQGHTPGRISPVKVKVVNVAATWAGLCFTGQNRITINGSIMHTVSEPFFLELLAHEVGHHIADHLSLSTKYPFHGKLWKQVAKKIGAFPFRTHLYPITSMLEQYKGQFFPYVFEDVVNWLTPEQHRKAKGKIKYSQEDWIFDADFDKALALQKSLEIKHEKELLQRVETQPWKHKTFWRHYGKIK